MHAARSELVEGSDLDRLDEAEVFFVLVLRAFLVFGLLELLSLLDLLLSHAHVLNQLAQQIRRHQVVLDHTTDLELVEPERHGYLLGLFLPLQPLHLNLLDQFSQLVEVGVAREGFAVDEQERLLHLLLLGLLCLGLLALRQLLGGLLVGLSLLTEKVDVVFIVRFLAAHLALGEHLAPHGGVVGNVSVPSRRVWVLLAIGARQHLAETRDVILRRDEAGDVRALLQVCVELGDARIRLQVAELNHRCNQPWVWPAS
mmetsp:Transcript_2086/g.4716  ORF Transcript_2086/g.4716 Transcript_2086/m.4716 type:complete len:257 (-) Transcript_2086:45-815(-)